MKENGLYDTTNFFKQSRPQVEASDLSSIKKLKYITCPDGTVKSIREKILTRWFYQKFQGIP